MLKSMARHEKMVNLKEAGHGHGKDTIMFACASSLRVCVCLLFFLSNLNIIKCRIPNVFSKKKGWWLWVFAGLCFLLFSLSRCFFYILLVYLGARHACF
jgi:hypothetical protein